MTPDTIDGLLFLLIVPIFGLALIAADIIYNVAMRMQQYYTIKRLRKEARL